MKPRQKDETDAQYIKRLEDANKGLKEHNAQLTAWGRRLNSAVTLLSTEGSVVFQAMAEKAGVRGHPSVTQAVKLFDAVSHPQWRDENEQFPEIQWPEDWSLEDCSAWSGDADMALNSPIDDAINLLENLVMSFRIPKDFIEPIRKVQSDLEKVSRKGVEGFKDQAGFKPVHIKPAPAKHYREMDAEELRELLSGLGWMALDLAQDMHFANNMLRRDLRASAYRRTCGVLYGMSQHAIEPMEGWPQFDVKVLGNVEAA